MSKTRWTHTPPRVSERDSNTMGERLEKVVNSALAQECEDPRTMFVEKDGLVILGPVHTQPSKLEKLLRECGFKILNAIARECVWGVFEGTVIQVEENRDGHLYRPHPDRRHDTRVQESTMSQAFAKAGYNPVSASIGSLQDFLSAPEPLPAGKHLDAQEYERMIGKRKELD